MVDSALDDPLVALVLTANAESSDYTGFGLMNISLTRPPSDPSKLN